MDIGKEKPIEEYITENKALRAKIERLWACLKDAPTLADMDAERFKINQLQSENIRLRAENAKYRETLEEIKKRKCLDKYEACRTADAINDITKEALSVKDPKWEGDHEIRD